MKWTRRKAIVGGIVAGGLLGVGFWFARERDRLGPRGLFNVGADEQGLHGWVKVTRDDRVIVAVDAKDGMVATSGWTSVSSITATDLANCGACGRACDCSLCASGV